MSDPARYDPEVAAEVLARAAALDAALAPGAAAPGLDESAVLAVGHDVGLSEVAVRKALAEHRAGSALAPAQVPRTRLMGVGAVVVDRVVDTSQSRALAAVEAGMRRGHLQRRRSLPLGSVWTPRQGPLAAVRRRLSPPGALGWVSRLDVQVARIDDHRSRVQVVAWCEGRRRGLASAAATGIGVAVLGTGALVGLALGVNEPLFFLGAPLTLATGPVSTRAARGAWIHTRNEVAMSLEGLLDGA